MILVSVFIIGLAFIVATTWICTRIELFRSFQRRYYQEHL